MDLASFFSGQTSFSPLADMIGLQPADIEQLATIAWQWLVLSAVVAWIGALIAGYRLLTAFRGQQQSEITAVLHMAAQRQRRQSWLWLSIILAGIVALFWLRIPHVLPHQQLNLPPDWPALWFFMLHTSEGWLWLARAGLALLAFGLLAALSISAHRRARRERAPDLLTRSEWMRRPLNRSGSAQHVAGNASLIPGRRQQANLLATQFTSSSVTLEQQLLTERRNAQISLAVIAALLSTLLLPLPDGESMRLPITALALNGAVLLALAVWLGSVLYLASVLVPATYIIESAERTQTLVEVFPAIRPTIVQALIAIALYSLFSVETRLTSFNSLLTLLSTSYGWILIAELVLLGSILLLTLYQARRALPFLAQAAWLAARGTVISMLGGVDVSRSLQITQRERQTLANQAERQLTRTAYAQVILGMLVLLCLVLASFVAGLPAI